MFVEKYPARLGRQVPPRVDRAGGPAVDQPDGGPAEGLRGAGQGQGEEGRRRGQQLPGSLRRGAEGAGSRHQGAAPGGGGQERPGGCGGGQVQSGFCGGNSHQGGAEWNNRGNFILYHARQHICPDARGWLRCSRRDRGDQVLHRGGCGGAPLQFFPAPGRIPSGYKWSCMETSEVHHKIPLYPDTPSPDKTLTGTELVYTEDGDILEGIRSFLDDSGTVFCMPENEEDCRGVLDALTKRFEYDFSISRYYYS